MNSPRQEIPSFSFIRVRAQLRAVDPIDLPPYSGSDFRGGFGAALRRSCCAIHRKSCDGCVLVASCAYAAVFETSAVHVSGNAYGLSNYPRPFVLEPPFRTDGRHRFVPGDRFSCELVLLGRFAEYLPFFAVALMELGRFGIGQPRGRFRLEEIADTLAEDIPIFDGEAGSFAGEPVRRSLADFRNDAEAPGRVTVELRTPLRLQEKNRLARDIDFRMFVRGLFRRLMLLMPVCDGGASDFDYISFMEPETSEIETEADLRWYDWRRFSHRQKRNMALGGVLGRLRFAGPLGKFMPLIRAGEFLHLGKACTFGLGRYRVDSLDEGGKE